MNRKEEQRRIKEEKREAAKRREKVRRGLWWAGLALIVPLTVFVLFYQGLFGGAPVLPPDQLGPNDHVRGAPDAPVTLTVYADFQCPACLTETQVINRAWPQIADRVRLVFRHFPLDTHRHAFLAARYAEAAARQGRFWEMHDLLYANQQNWSTLADVRQVFNGYALQLSLDMEQFERDLGSSEVRDKIVADQQGGIRAGVRGTPSLYLNGRIVANPRSAGALVAMVEGALGSR